MENPIVTFLFKRRFYAKPILLKRNFIKVVLYIEEKQNVK